MQFVVVQDWASSVFLEKCKQNIRLDGRTNENIDPPPPVACNKLQIVFKT